MIPEDALRLSWDEVYQLTLQLSEQIKRDTTARGEKFDRIIVVPRGGYYPANIIAREMGFTAIDLAHANLTSYQDKSTQRGANFKLGQMPTDTDIKDKNLLILDEVCDTGLTLQFLVDRFVGQGADLVRSAVLHYKPSLSQTGYQPDWFVEETDKWVVYPWEKQETNQKS